VSVTKEIIIDLSLRYITSEEMVDFPESGHLFCILMRALLPDRVLKHEEGWGFSGYGICKGYTFDEEAKPRGKWIWMHYLSLATFPPLPQALKLQPPHIAKGQFQSADRTHEIRIIKVDIESEIPAHVRDIVKQDSKKGNEPSHLDTKSNNVAENKKIVAFRKKSDT
jgi:hypothetical protein